MGGLEARQVRNLSEARWETFLTSQNSTGAIVFLGSLECWVND